MWKEVPRTRKKEVLSSHHVESSRPSLTTVSLEVLARSVMVKLYYSLVYSHLTYAFLAWGRQGLTNAAKIECAHRRACKLLADYNHRILTFHSIYDYFALLKAFLSTQIPLIIINISKTNIFSSTISYAQHQTQNKQ